MRPQETTDTRLAIGLLLARVMLGIIFIMHGYQKLFENGVSVTQGGFASLGVPLADVSAIGLIALELIGGVALVLGIGTRIVGVLGAIAMLGAMYFAHRDAGFFAQNGGFEYVLLLAVLSGALALTGPGAWSLESLLRWSSTASTTTPRVASGRR